MAENPNFYNQYLFSEGKEKENSEKFREYCTRILKENSNQSDDCIEWSGNLTEHGYGTFYARRRSWLVHRISFSLHNGKMPDKLHICHICNNKKCINPEHLYAGTPKQNAEDYRKSDTYAKYAEIKKAFLTSKIPNVPKFVDYLPQEISKMNEYLNKSEAAKFIGVSECTFRYWGKKNPRFIRIYPHPITGRPMYLKSDLENFLRRIQENPLIT